MSDAAGGPPLPEIRLLHHRPFLLYFVGRGFSRFAAQMATVALGWQVYEKTGSAFHLGLIGLAQFLPVALLVFVAGHVADRYDRQRVVQACQVAQAIAAGFLCWGSYEGWLTVPAIYGAVALLGVATAFELPATAALLTGVAPRGQFQRAAALSTGMFQVAVISGPAIGGFAYAVGPARALRDHGHLLGDRQRPQRRDPPGGAGRRAAAAASRRSLRRDPLRAQRQGDPRDDLARPLRRPPRRGDGADADLSPATSCRPAPGASACCARRRRSARWR